MKTSQKILALALVLILVGGLAGCAKAQVPNPIVEYASAEELANQGFELDAPAGAKDVFYSVINGTLGQVSFTFEGADYTYRATKAALVTELTDISGIYAELKEGTAVKTVASSRGETELSYCQYVDGGWFARWAWGDMVYCLTTDTDVSSDVLLSVATALAEA